MFKGGIISGAFLERGKPAVRRAYPAIVPIAHKGIPDTSSHDGTMEKRADLRNSEPLEQRIHGRMQYDDQDVEEGMLRVQEF